jgi:hypothetical protein
VELSELTDKAIDYMLPELESLVESDDRRLTPWEKDFIPSISEQWTRRRWLSGDQKKSLGKIWDKI